MLRRLHNFVREGDLYPSRPFDDLEFLILPPKVSLKFQGTPYEPMKIV